MFQLMGIIMYGECDGWVKFTYERMEAGTHLLTWETNGAWEEISSQWNDGAGADNIILKSGADTELINSPGNNTVTIQSGDSYDSCRYFPRIRIDVTRGDASQPNRTDIRHMASRLI